MTSPRTAERLTRILAMLPWVIANPGVSVAEVLERFGYEDEKELAGDLNIVFVCGLPGYGPGELMDAYIDEDEVVVDMADYFSHSLRLSPVEALSLLAAGMALMSTGQAPEALAGGVAKLQQILLPEGEEALVVELAPEPEVAATLRKAAADGMVLGLTYTGLASGETTQRLVEPWSVFSTLGNWYLSGFCRSAQAERVFRVDRVRSAEITRESFEPPAEPPPPVVRYTPGEDDVRATIRLGPTAQWVAEYYPVEVVGDEGDGLVIHFSAGDASVAARLLLRLGADAELMEGSEVSAALDDVRARILARYGG